jgi:cystathionine beta-synthase
MYNDAWMRDEGYLDADRKPATAADVLAQLGERPLMSLSPEDTMQVAINMLRDKGISQVPIIEQDRVVGGLQEVTLARLMHEGRDPRTVKLREIMARPLPETGDQTSVDEVYRLLLSGNTGVIIRKAGKIAGIITRIDLVNFWDAPSSKK